MLRLKELRKEKGLTLKELSSKLGMSESTISLYENGKRRPEISTLESIADFFSVTVDYLLCRTDSPSAEIPVALSAPKGYDKLTEAEREQIEKLVDMFANKNRS